jgi:sterol 3beta-glucosyltransferase
MKITIFASGTRGDVQPYIALGKGLHQAGYSVRLLTTDDFQGLAEAAGLEFYSTGTSIEAMLQSPEWRALSESGNFLKILQGMNRAMKEHAGKLSQRLPDLCAGSDLMITGVAGFIGPYSVAEKLNIPYVQAYLFPVTPTRAFSGPLTPNLPLGAIFNPLSFQVVRQALWQSGRVGDAMVRQQLGMKPRGFWGPFGALDRLKIPVLYGYSAHVLPRPADWDDRHVVTGWWYLDEEEWEAPQDLLDFLSAGPAPVYIGFGSMGSKNPAEAAALAVEALQLSGQRGVIASGWGGMRQADLPDTVYMMKAAPHHWLFPRMAAVVHHGGVGTTAAGLRAGVPSIIIPFMGDQPFWGKRVADLGVGPQPIPRQQLTAAGLVTAIRTAVTNTVMQQKAHTLGEHIRAEDGVRQAITVIQQMLRVPATA